MNTVTLDFEDLKKKFPKVKTELILGYTVSLCQFLLHVKLKEGKVLRTGNKLWTL